MSVAGRSPKSNDRFVQVDSPVAGLNRTSKTWPGVAGVDKSKPRYEIQAWFASAGSMKIDETKRPGALLPASSSSRVNVTELAGSAPAFFEITTWPFCAAAQRVFESEGARSAAVVNAFAPATKPANPAGPSGSQSPHVTAKSPVHSLQCWRKSARLI